MDDTDIYEILNMDKVINAAGAFTAIGGSRMNSKTLEHIKEAAGSHIEIRKLQHVLHDKIATLTHNEDAYISNGAATGIYLSMAACIQLKMNKKFQYISSEEIQKKEVLMFTAHRNPYDWAVRQLGVKIVQIGYPNNVTLLSGEDVNHAVTDETVAIFYVAGGDQGWLSQGALPYSEVVRQAEKCKVPLIVDAAAQLPPVQNLWRYTEKGADAVVFSGGKDLGGPQSSGLVLGRKQILQAVQELGFPNYGIGRMMKVGREEMVGLYSALYQYVEMNHEERLHWCENQIAYLSEPFKQSQIFSVKRSFPNVAGQPIPRGFIRILDPGVLTSKGLMTRLMEEQPRIYTTMEEQGVYINPIQLKDGEMDQIIKKLKSLEEELKTPAYRP